MTKLTNIFKTTCLSSMLLAVLPMQSMEHVKFESHDISQLPDETLFQILDSCHVQDTNPIVALEKSIKNFIKMSGACKKFSNLLSTEKIGKLCEWYDLETKNKTFLKIFNFITDVDYKKMKLPASILVSSGANPNIATTGEACLLKRAIMHDDIEFAKKLLLHYADPNSKHWDCPIFFCGKNKTMIQLLVKYGLNVHAVQTLHITKDLTSTTNVLSRVLDNKYPADLMAYYLECGVDAKLLLSDKSSLLHDLAWWHHSFEYTKNSDNFLEKATLLLDAIGDIINLQSAKNTTALDLAYASLAFVKKCNFTYQGQEEDIRTYEQLIALFRKYGGLTAQELETQKINKAKGLLGNNPYFL